MKEHEERIRGLGAYREEGIVREREREREREGEQESVWKGGKEESWCLGRNLGRWVDHGAWRKKRMGGGTRRNIVWRGEGAGEGCTHHARF